MPTNRPIIINGARVLIYINSRLFGRATSFSWTSTTPKKSIHTIDTPIATELAATTVDCTWTMGIIRSIGDGGAQGAGIAPQQTDLSREKYFTLLLLERETDLTIFRSDNNECDSESWTVTAKGLMAGQASGKGLVWSNESG